MIVDSSFLVALFLPEDELHQKALIELNKLQKEKFLLLTIPHQVLEETFTVLTYKRTVSYALSVLEKLFHNEAIVVYHLAEEEWFAIKQFIHHHQKKISFTDYVVIYLALRSGKTVLCFDEQILAFLRKN